jgi:hypothetical protein
MMSSEFTSLVVLRAREEELQRNAERFRVIKERQAELLAEHGHAASREGESLAARAFSAIFSRRRQEAEPVCQ